MAHDGDQVPDFRSLEDSAVANALIRRENGENSISHDSGPWGDRVVMFGAEDGVRMRREACARRADGTFRDSPSIWEKPYTIRAVTHGYFLPCVYAILPGKAGETYQRMWRQVREAVGEAEAADQRLVPIDCARTSIGVVQESFPAARIQGCYFRRGQSARRNVQRLGIQKKYADGDCFRLRVKMLRAAAFPPEGDVVDGSELSDREFLGGLDSPDGILRIDIRC